MDSEQSQLLRLVLFLGDALQFGLCALWYLLLEMGCRLDPLRHRPFWSKGGHWGFRQCAPAPAIPPGQDALRQAGYWFRLDVRLLLLPSWAARRRRRHHPKWLSPRWWCFRIDDDASEKDWIAFYHSCSGSLLQSSWTEL